MNQTVELARLELLGVLSCRRWTFVVSQSTYDRLRDILGSHERGAPDRGTMFLHSEQELALVETTPEQREQYHAFLRSVPEAVRAHCQIRPCPQAAGLDPRQRTTIDEVLGRHNLETMLLARGDEALLWTDDHVMSLLSQTDFKTCRVWTQVVLFEGTQHTALTQEAYDRAVARLVGFHYQSTHWNAATLVGAADVAGWDTTRWPVREVMRELGNPDTPAVGRLTMAAEAIRTVYGRGLPWHSRQGFLFAIFTGMGSVGLLRRLLQHIPHIFGLDVLSADEVSDFIRFWISHPTGLVTR